MGSNGKRKKGKPGKPNEKKSANGAGSSAPPPPPKKDEAKSEALAAETEAEARASQADIEARATEKAEREADTDPPAARVSSTPPPPNAAAAEPVGAAWAEPLVRFEKKWTAFESKLIVGVLAAQIIVLVAWVGMKGLSQPVTELDSAGRVFRAVFGLCLLGALAWRFTSKLPLEQRRYATVAGVLVGGIVGWSLGSAGQSYFDNMKSWLQEASLLTLMGGLRGLATRFTLWLALLGGSLATAAGKHIHIDLIFRFLPKKNRKLAAIINYSSAAVVCFLAVWGFFDHISQSLGAKADASATAKMGETAHVIDDRFFLVRKQIGLDLRALPRVVAGTRYDQWMTGADWNAWVKDAGFEARYKADDIKTLLVSDDTPYHAPLVISPTGESARGLLVDLLSLVFPFGLFAIGLRFLLRALFTASGHLSADPDEMHKEDLRSAQTPHAPTDDAAEGGV